MRYRRIRAHGAAAIALVLAAMTAVGVAAPAAKVGDVDTATIAGFEKDGSQWPSSAGGYSEQRFSPLTQINRNTVARLGFAWEADLNADRGVEATPIVVDGVMYVSSTGGQVFAFDAATGRELWAFHPTNRPS